MKKQAYHSPTSTSRRSISLSPPKGSPIHGEGKISIRVDQPVANCQVMTHAFFRSRDGDIDDKEVDLQFHWYRSGMRQACANLECPRHGEGNIILLVAKLECVMCCRLGITREHSCFCSPECFRLGWQKHKQLHQKFDAIEFEKDKVALKSQLYNMDTFCPRQEESWIDINHSE
jgi:CCR4-NOT transcription complex subunit 6